MKNLSNLFKLIELTRSQVQYGYLLGGMPKDKLSNLAEHHYLVSFIAWQLALHLNEGGANIDVQKVLEFALIHDLGELMGGDISGPYARSNPKARKFAKAFEAENQKYLSKFFGKQSAYFRKLSKEILDAKSDEALVAKVADYLEVSCFMIYTGHYTPSDQKFNTSKLEGYIKKMKNKVAKQILTEFVEEWAKSETKVDYMKLLTGEREKENIEFVLVEE